MAKLGIAPRSNSLTLAQISCLSDIVRKSKKSRKMFEQKKSRSLEECSSEGLQNERNTLLTWSKTYDPSFSKEVEKEIIPAQRRTSLPNLMKHSTNFHRVFKDFSEEEELLETFSCAWLRDMPYYGRLYISHSHVCFYCSMLRREVKVVIPVPTISILKKANTALLVPNAICIRTTEGEKFLFGAIRSRESAYQLLRSVCKHLQDSSQNSPTTSSNSSDHLMKGSPSSKESAAYHNLPRNEIPPEETDEPERILIPAEASCERQRQVITQQRAEQTVKALRSWGTQLCCLNTIITIYLFLVILLLCSSGYIGLRIVQLEEQLTSMGAWPELNLQRPYKGS